MDTIENNNNFYMNEIIFIADGSPSIGITDTNKINIICEYFDLVMDKRFKSFIFKNAINK